MNIKDVEIIIEGKKTWCDIEKKYSLNESSYFDIVSVTPEALMSIAVATGEEIIHSEAGFWVEGEQHFFITYNGVRFFTTAKDNMEEMLSMLESVVL